MRGADVLQESMFTVKTLHPLTWRQVRGFWRR